MCTIHENAFCTIKDGRWTRIRVRDTLEILDDKLILRRGKKVIGMRGMDGQVSSDVLIPPMAGWQRIELARFIATVAGRGIEFDEKKARVFLFTKLPK